MMRRWFQIPNPTCLMFGHNFTTERGKTYCTTCGYVVR